MSKPRYGWWPYVKDMIRRYPQLAREYADIHDQAVTQNYEGLPGGGGDGRTLERIAIRELPDNRQREYEAVRSAIEVTQRYHNGADRLKVVELVLLRGSRNLEGAAMEIPCAYITARRYHWEFINLVAGFYGFLDGTKK